MRHLHGKMLAIWVFAASILIEAQDLSIHRYAWRTSDWEPCQGDICGSEGRTFRQVTCINTLTNSSIPHSNCTQLPRPPSHKQCFLVCDLNKYQYHWQMTKWTSCEPRIGKEYCEETFGFQYRNVTCVSLCGKMAPDESLCGSFNEKPVTKQTCDMTCVSSQCITSDFSAWSHCDSCFRSHRSRHKTVLSAPSPRGNSYHGYYPCPELAQHEICQRDRTCFELRTTNFQYRLGNWSKCRQLEGKLAKKLATSGEILGQQRRVVECSDVHGHVVDLKYCTHISDTDPEPVTSRLCVKPRDCLVSQWSTWSNWTSLQPPYPPGVFTDAHPKEKRQRMDFAALKGRDEGAATRERSLMEVPLGTGDKCPSLLLDTRVKQPPTSQKQHNCDSFHWITGNWGQCISHGDDTCGKGIQHRTVLCARAFDRVPVEDYNCIAATPKFARKCDIPCPSPCVVTRWGAWSECLRSTCDPYQATHKGYRQRKREISVPAEYDGLECPHLIETQSCDCKNTWRVQESASHCELPFGDMTCGNGTKYYAYACFDTDGNEVGHNLCDSRPVRSEPCHIPCPNDCVISPWLEWSSCSQSCQSQTVSGFRTRHRVRLAEATSGGRSCPMESRFYIQHEHCRDLPDCQSYHWKALDWSECHLSDASEECGNGIQTRDIYCVREPEGHRVAPRRCVEEFKPSTQKNCSIPCMVSCQMSEFTHWSPCPVTCLSEKSTAKQMRTRFVLRMPEHVTVDYCPHRYEERSCDHLPRCLDFRWVVHPWGVCTVNDVCGDGYALREVECQNSEGEVLDLEMCVEELGYMPDLVQKCHVTCDINICGLSEWSEWSLCSKLCGGSKSRTRSRVEIPSSKECYDTLQYPLDMEQPCSNCRNYASQPIGTWSSCIMEEKNDLHAVIKENLPAIAGQTANKKLCGIGNRYHAMICSNGSHNTSIASCGLQVDEFSSEMCLMPCPTDCTLSEWNAWSECSTQQRCGLGRRSRYRYIVNEALDGGRPCPDMVNGEEYEHDICSKPCERFEWRSNPWSPCTPQLQIEEGPWCGPGLQTRIVKCYKLIELDSSGNSHAIQAHDSDCGHLLRPSDHNANCLSPCVGECVLTQWSDWSECPLDCSGQRIRQRSIAREPLHLRQSCPDLYQQESCILNANCFTYNITWSSWSACHTEYGQPCGQGVEISYGQCIRSNGELEAMQYCSVLTRGTSGVLKRECEVPCPIDCVLSEWTPWTPCNVSCGLGYQTRSRHLVVHSRYNGRPCSDVLEHIRPCSYSECFKWTVSDWSPCQLEKHSCGYGEQTRELMCERHDGVIVDIRFCPEGGKTFIQLERTCHEPCAGDCAVSDWSSWGLCHHPCVSGITVGIQTRSRATINPAALTGHQCPYDLIENRECASEECPTYHWRTSEWFGDRRHVWCERHDGVQVEGGCAEFDKPKALKTCEPSCYFDYSFCRDINYCECVFGYDAVRDENGFLTECVKIRTDTVGESLYDVLPDNDPTNIWMYAVIAVAVGFIIFVSVALYFIFKNTRKERNYTETPGTKSTLLTTTNSRGNVNLLKQSPVLLPKHSEHELRQTNLYKQDVT